MSPGFCHSCYLRAQWLCASSYPLQPSQANLLQRGHVKMGLSRSCMEVALNFPPAIPTHLSLLYFHLLLSFPICTLKEETVRDPRSIYVTSIPPSILNNHIYHSEHGHGHCYPYVIRLYERGAPLLPIELNILIRTLNTIRRRILTVPRK